MSLSKTMQAVVVVEPGRVQLREVPRPVPGPGEVLIETLAAGICATDLEMIAGWDRTGCPSIPGHEWSGRVAEVGPGVNHRWLGRAVVADNVITCGHCPACRRGQWNACPDSKEVGFELPGAYGQFFVTQADHLIELPANIPTEQAPLVEPLAVAVHGMERLGVRPGHRCVVLGDGPIGLLCLQLARAAGGRDIILVGGHAERLTLAAELGAAHCINYHQAGEELAGRILDLHGGSDRVVEASGSVRAAEQAIDFLGQMGRLLVLGDYRQHRAAIPMLKVLLKNLTLVGANASPGTWHRAVALAGSGQVRLGPLVTHRYSRAEFAEALELVRGKRDGVIKAVFV
jgi:2-desacetyl-2-hydroxyethyl bacteriochlorophyllide A dehydrogenase